MKTFWLVMIGAAGLPALAAAMPATTRIAESGIVRADFDSEARYMRERRREEQLHREYVEEKHREEWRHRQWECSHYGSCN